MRIEFLKNYLARTRNRASQAIQRMQGKKAVHILHIGKTGGTAVRHALKPYVTKSKHYIIVPHPHSFKLKDVPEGEHVVFFLRDPISRFTSGFFSRQRQGRPKYYLAWRAQEEIAFKEFDTPNSLALALSSDDEEKRARAKTAMNGIQHVRNHYGEWLESETYLQSRLRDLFFIGFQESLDDDFEALKSKLGLPAEVTLPDDDILAHRNPDETNRALDDLAVRNLMDWYQEDYNFVAICKKIRTELLPGQVPSAG